MSAPKIELPKGRNVMRGMLALVLVSSFMLALFWVIQHEVPEGNQQLVTYMLGQLSVLAGMPIAFYFASSKSSQEKNEMLEEAMPQPSKKQRVIVDNDPSRPVPTEEAENVTPARSPLPRPGFPSEE